MSNIKKRKVFNVKDTISGKISLIHYLPWHSIITYKTEAYKNIGIVIQKDGCIQQTFGFRGQDLESYSEEAINTVFAYFNAVLKSLEDGWMVSIEAQRYETREYPQGEFENLTGFLVDKEREATFKNREKHFESSYYITFTYKPVLEIQKKVFNLFIKETETEEQHEKIIQEFLKVTDSATGMLQAKFIIRPLTMYETFLYLHSTCSMQKQHFILPDHFYFLDRAVSTDPIEIGMTCKLGEYYIPIGAINDFPMATYPLILNELNKLEVELRWVTRYFPLGKEEGRNELEKWQKKHFAGRKSFKQYMAEVTMNIESQRENRGSIAKQDEVEQAQVALETDIVGFGYYNSSIMVYDKDYKKAMEKFKKVKTIINRVGFGCVEETHNAFNAFMGMTAGDPYWNIRRPLVSTGNVAHALPLSAIWAGMLQNKFTDQICGIDIPLVTTSTQSGTPFYLNLNQGDVGHTLILGPTGAGKSTLLQTLEVSYLKYPDSQVFIIDKGMSALTLTLAVGGEYINPAVDNISFQPLADLETNEDRLWALEFIETLLYVQGIKVTAKMTTAITQTITQMADPIYPVQSRTLTNFVLNCVYQDENGNNTIDEALQPYTLKGAYGKIFDGDNTFESDCPWIMMELETLMESTNSASKEKVIAPAILYIFKFLQKRFTGKLTLLVLDEAWVFLEHPIFENKMKEWLKTLRKKNVFCVFATQEVVDVAQSNIASTIIQNCPTKIYLADDQALSLKEGYKKFGLTEEEIQLLQIAIKKQDYLYKSVSGTRLFQLELGSLQLALFRQQKDKIRLPDGEVIEWGEYCQYLLEMKKKHKSKKGLVTNILDAQQVDYKKYLEGIDYED